jgi:hypothetical protein
VSLALLGAGTWLLWRRRQKAAKPEEVTFLDQKEEKSELPGEAKTFHEMNGAVDVQELKADHQRAELAGMEPQELPTDWHGYEVPYRDTDDVLSPAASDSHKPRG